MSITNYEQEKLQLASGKSFIIYLDKDSGTKYISAAAIIRYVCSCSQGAAEIFIMRELDNCLEEQAGAAMTVFMYDVDYLDAFIEKLSTMRPDKTRIQEIEDMLRTLKTPKKNVQRPTAPECMVKEVIRDVHVENAKKFFEASVQPEKKESPSEAVKKSWNTFQRKLREDDPVKEMPVKVPETIETKICQEQPVVAVVAASAEDVSKKAEIKVLSKEVPAKIKSAQIVDSADNISELLGTPVKLVKHKISLRVSAIKVYVNHNNIILAVDAPSVVAAINPYGHYGSLTYNVRNLFIGENHSAIRMEDYHELCDCVIKESPLSKYQRSRAIQISCMTANEIMLAGNVTDIKDRVDIINEVPSLERILSNMNMLYTALQGSEPTNEELKTVFTNLNKDIKKFIGSL